MNPDNSTGRPDSMTPRAVYRRPLVDLEAATVMMDRDKIDILRLCEDGSLAWAWDLSRTGTGRSAVRIFLGSIRAWLQKTNGDRDLSEDQVMAEIIPPRNVTTAELKRRWAVSRNLIADLIQDGRIRVMKAGTKKQGVNSASHISFEELHRFMRTRRIGSLVQPPKSPKDKPHSPGVSERPQRVPASLQRGCTRLQPGLEGDHQTDLPSAQAGTTKKTKSRRN